MEQTKWMQLNDDEASQCVCAVLSLCANISNDWLHIQRVQIQSVWLSIRIGELLEANASIEYLQSFHHGWAIHSEIIVSNAIRYSPLHLLSISLSSSLRAFFSVCLFVCFSAFILSIRMQNVWISYDAKFQESHTIPFHCRLHYSNFEYFDAINCTLFQRAQHTNTHVLVKNAAVAV